MPPSSGTLSGARRVLVTGASGFVGPYVLEAVRRVCGPDTVVIPTVKPALNQVLGEPGSLDVTDEAAVNSFINRTSPTHVIHLAGIASTTTASVDPSITWQVHVHGTLNVARAILDHAPNCSLIYVGSGLIYGQSARSGSPVDEQTVLAPTDEYSVTKAAADLALGALTRRGLKCIRLRPFNHSGPGQTDEFVIPAFAAQIARIEIGESPPVIRVGNLEAERDFLDVRDVAEAYALAVLHGGRLEEGAILNIASGIPRRISDILRLLLSLSSAKISVDLDAARVRPVDLPRIVGNAEKARMMLNWKPRHPFEQTLAEILADSRKKVRLTDRNRPPAAS